MSRTAYSTRGIVVSAESDTDGLVYWVKWDTRRHHEGWITGHTPDELRQI